PAPDSIAYGGPWQVPARPGPSLHKGLTSFAGFAKSKDVHPNGVPQWISRVNVPNVDVFFCQACFGNGFCRSRSLAVKLLCGVSEHGPGAEIGRAFTKLVSRCFGYFRSQFGGGDHQRGASIGKYVTVPSVERICNQGR